MISLTPEGLRTKAKEILCEALLVSDEAEIYEREINRILPLLIALVEAARREQNEKDASYLEDTLAGNHPHLAHAYKHAAANLRAQAPR